MSACMQETYGRPLSTFSNSKKAMDLKTLQPNLSGKPNPGSKSLLAQMKGRKQQVHNIENVSYRGKLSHQNMIF